MSSSESICLSGTSQNTYAEVSNFHVLDITPVSVASKTFLISNEEIYCPIFDWKSGFTAP